MQRETGISRYLRAYMAATPATKVGNDTSSRVMNANIESITSTLKADGSLAAWLARYEPVEREIIEAHERRIANRRRNSARRREKSARAFGDLCEATEGFAVVWRREGWSVRDMVRWADGDVLTLLTLTRWLGGETSKFIDRAQSRLRRPLYYAQERARREALAEERRRVGRRRTTNPCPAREEILEAWTKRCESHAEAVRFGSMVHDLECYVDNTLLRNGTGTIVGRRGGVKAWLQENIPALYVRYTTVMRYKAMAKKLRQVVGLADPVPAEAVLAESPSWKGEGKQDYGEYEIFGDGRKDFMNGQSSLDAPEGTRAKMYMEVPDLAVVRARAVWLEVVKGVRDSSTALIERLDALTDPERVDESNMLAQWRVKYENEITVRMKSRWWRRSATPSEHNSKHDV